MSDLRQELWEWQEHIDSPHAAKLLLVRTIQRLNGLEAVLAAARSANNHWNEFGPEYDFDRTMDAVHRAIHAADSKETK